MAWSTSDSAVRLSKADEEHIASLTSSAAIAAYIHDLELHQNLRVRDAIAPELLLPVDTEAAAPATPASQRYTRVVTVGTIQKTIEADSEQGLDAAEAQYYRDLFAQGNAASHEQSPARDAQGRFVAQEEADAAAARAELDLKFRRGEISPYDYTKQYEQIEANVFQGSWKSATEQFLASEAGKNWPGGERNKQILGEIIQANGLIESPSVETLAKAFEFARANNLLTADSDADYEAQIAACKTPEEVSAVSRHFAGRSSDATSSGFFGR